MDRLPAKHTMLPFSEHSLFKTQLNIAPHIWKYCHLNIEWLIAEQNRKDFSNSICCSVQNFFTGLALIENYCRVNQSISNRIEVSYTGCALYRLQLAVWEIMREKTVVLSQLKQLMTKMSALLLSAKLRRETHLKRNFNYEYHWRSIYQTLFMHAEVWEHELQLL